MFTLKAYSDSGFRQVIFEAESFTILRGEDNGAEITLHRRAPSEDIRLDVSGLSNTKRPEGFPPEFDRVIIENAMGRTTEIIASDRTSAGIIGRAPDRSL